MDKRFGFFSIYRYMIEDYPEEVRTIMGQVIVLQAEVSPVNNTVEYLALCEQFDPVANGGVPDDYQVIVTNGVVIFTKKKEESKIVLL